MDKETFNSEIVRVIGFKVKYAAIYPNGSKYPVFRKIRCGGGVFGRNTPHLEHWENGDAKHKRFIPCTYITSVVDDEKFLAVRAEYEDGGTLLVRIDK